jgi:hypothetical protein
MPQQQAAGIGRTVTRILRYAFLGPIAIAHRRKESKGDHYLLIALELMMASGAMAVGFVAVMFSAFQSGLSTQEMMIPVSSEPYVVQLLLLWLFGVMSIAVLSASTEYGRLFLEFEVQNDLSFYVLLIASAVSSGMYFWFYQSVTAPLLRLELPWLVVFAGAVMFLNTFFVLLGFFTIIAGVHVPGWLFVNRYGDQIRNGLNDFF